jgi:hypothetical protein
VAIREGKWKCSYCGQANQGRDGKCAQCGQVRGRDVNFYLDDDAAEASDPELLGAAKAGADWTCSFCATNNRGNAAVCRQCGAERGSSAALKEKIIPLMNAAPGNPVPLAGAPKKKVNPLGIAIGIAAALIACFAVYFLFFTSSEKTGLLERGSWQRSIPVEAFMWNQHDAWEGQVPANAIVLSSRREKYGTEKIQTGSQRVKTGTRDMGNGFFEDVYEDKPVYEERDVYKNKISYKIQEWTQVRVLKKEGELGAEPVWPEATLALGEREGPRSESATLFFSVGKKPYRKSVAVGELGSCRVGGAYRIWVTPLGAVTKFRLK